MAYSELQLDGFIDEVKEVSAGYHTRKFCFVLGAGASITSGIKSGQELVDIWDRELQKRTPQEYSEWKKRLKITKDNKYSFYSQYYEERYKKHPRDGYNFLEKMMENAVPQIGYVILAYLLCETSHNVVITTNFDHLTEDAVNYYMHTMPSVISHESLAHYITEHITRPTIIKIHRDLLFDPANRTDEIGKLHENWEKALSLIFKEYHPIFIGYAGNDKSLMNFLNENSDKFLNGDFCFPYWTLYNKDKLSSMAKTFLEGSDGYLIRHNGFDEVLCYLGDAFDYKLPSEEDFLNDPKSRYRTLSNSFNKFTEKAFNDDEHSETKLTEAVQSISNQADLLKMYREVIIMNNEGKYEEALKLNKELIKLDPQNAIYHNGLGNTYSNLNRFNEAISEYKTAIVLDPNDADYHHNLATTLSEMKCYDNAIAEHKTAIDLDPNDARYHNNLACTLYEVKRYDEAIAEYQIAIDLDPNDANYHNNFANTLSELKRYDEAIAEYQIAIDLAPNDARYHNNLALTLSKMKRFDDAIAEYKTAIDLDPNDARYHNNLANTLSELKRYDEAIAEFQTAIDLDPNDARYHYNSANTLSELKRYDEAIAEFQTAIDLDPNDSIYHNNLAVALFAIKNFIAAITEYKKAIKLNPIVSGYHYNLANALYETKCYDEAIAEYQAAVNLEPNNKEYQEKLKVVIDKKALSEENEDKNLQLV